MANSWGTLTFEIPDFLEDTRNAINSIAEWMVAVLDVVLVALNFVKTFLVGFLDPIVALVQALLDEINRLLRDLRQLGLYITGDWNMLADPDSLKGGFQEYERRMIARLTDRTDPTRPDVSGATTVLSLFFYVSVDLSEWDRLIRTIRALVAYFKQFPKIDSPYPACVITEVLYGASAANLFNFGDLGSFFTKNPTPPAMALVKWKMDAAIKGSEFLPPVSIPPGGFVVTVSTVPEGIPIVYDRPQGDQTKKEVPGQTIKAQPREYGAVMMSDGRPFILHGGAEMLAAIPGDLTFNAGVVDGVLQDGHTRVYGLLGSSRPPVPIDLLQWKTASPFIIVPKEHQTVVTGQALPKFYVQRTFFVSPAAVGAAFATGGYSILLDRKEMPRAAHFVVNTDGQLELHEDGPASTLYVRVAPCAKSVASSGSFKYEFLSGTKAVTGQPIMVGVQGTEGNTPAQIGEFSAPQQIVFANANTEKYLLVLRTALLVLVLVRPDLQPVDLLEGTVSTETLENIKKSIWITEGVALGRCGLESVKHLTGVVYDQKTTYAEALKVKDTAPMTFRQDLFERITLAAHDIYSKTGPMPDVEAFVVSQTKYLREVTWGQILKAAHPEDTTLLANDTTLPKYMQDATLWQSLGEPSLNFGIARNPTSAVGGHDEMGATITGNPDVTQDRDPQMQAGYVDRLSPRWEESIIYYNVFDSEELLQSFLDSTPTGLRAIYEKCVSRDESGNLVVLNVPVDWATQLETASTQKVLAGSADNSPVFFYGDTSPLRVYYCRGLFVKSDLQTGQQADKGSILQQASLALRVAGAAIRRSLSDGDWIYIRWFDTMPGLEDFFATLANWMEAIRASLQSIIDTIKKYIEYIEARIVELQQLIRRINSLIQSILGFMFQIPKCSALTLISNGTGGVLADLVQAENKPSDSPLAYGAGVAVVVPLFPSFALLDLLLAFWKSDPGGSPSGFMGQDPATVQGIDGVPVVPPDPVVPDVL